MKKIQFKTRSGLFLAILAVLYGFSFASAYIFGTAVRGSFEIFGFAAIATWLIEGDQS